MIIQLTHSARDHFKTQLQKRGAKAVRLAVKNGGCSGLKYALDYAQNAEEGDVCEFFEENLTVFIDPKSVVFLQGLCIDYIQQGLNGMIQFLNPNENGSCGCGESFAVKN